ncbi:MAG: adenine nucleotide alpha hydrolase family protein [Candidatus Diapherotrites archaeon]|nr:adenine nucleotide alpha hydrolase family protein [Candidatus Diapherotrites archaeon]
MAKCGRCGKKAEILLPYGPHNFCRAHFIEFFERRVRRTISRHGLIRRGEKVAVGLSGGKDSSATLFLLNKFFPKSNEIIAIMLDEGIPKYRDRALKIAEENCKKWKIKYVKRTFKNEFGITMMQIMRKIAKDENLGSTCSFCGVLRRHLLNKIARELKCAKIATGHNLDDEAQSILMNIFDNDPKRLARLGAIAGTEEIVEFVPRIKPLYETPEKDIIAYASFNGIKSYSEECCPFKWQAKRNLFRSELDKFEEKSPGTKYKILSFFKNMKPLLEKNIRKESLHKCAKCRSITSEKNKYCNVCLQLAKVKK